MTGTQVLEGAEAFSLGEGSTGVLMIHGYTGSPQGLRELGEYLADKGLACHAPRLPGHGTTWEDLGTRRAEEWRGEVEAAYGKIAEGRDEVFVVALSFGAALAVDLIARHPGAVKGLVTLAGFVHTDDPRRFLAPVIKRVVKTLPGVGNDIKKPGGREIAYERIPTSATHEMLKTIAAARADLPKVDCPLLVLHGREDHTVKPYNANMIHDNVSSADKEVVWLEDSYHVITLDNDRDEVFQRTYDFIKERSAHAI